MEKLKTFVILAELDCIAVLLVVLQQKGIIDQTLAISIAVFALLCTITYLARWAKMLQAMTQR